MVMCRRSSSHALLGPGRFKADKNGQTLHFFRLRGPIRNSNRPFRDPNPEPQEPPQPLPSKKRASKVYSPERYAIGFTDRRASQLAVALRLPVWAVKVPGVGFNPNVGEADVDGVFTFAERDGTGRVVGFHYRFPDGSKKHEYGTPRGLFVTDGWNASTDPLYLVEGASDVLAASAAGLPAIGRPSNVAGVPLLVELLAQAPRDRLIIVTGENDPKPDGSWPGRHGAYATATSLAAGLGRPVMWAMVPPEAKDVREWLTQRVGEKSTRAKWIKAGDELAGELFLNAVDTGPEWPEYPGPQPELPRCLKAYNGRLKGKKDTRAAGKRTSSAFRCDSWVCPACRSWKANRLQPWFFRCLLQWSDPDRMHEAIPRIDVPSGCPTGERGGGPSGPWNLFAATLDGPTWLQTKKSLENNNKRSRQAEYLSVKGEGGTVFALAALAPGVRTPSCLTRVSSDNAVSLMEHAFRGIPENEVKDDERFRAVNQSRNWAPQTDAEEGNWEHEGQCSRTIEEAKEVVESLNGVDLPELAPRGSQEAVVWGDGAVGGSLASWIASAVLDKRHTGAVLSVSEAIARARGWINVVVEQQLPDLAEVRDYLRLCLGRNPQGSDGDVLLRIAEESLAKQRNEAIPF